MLSVSHLLKSDRLQNGNDQIKAARALIAKLAERNCEDFTHAYSRVDCPVLAGLKYADTKLSDKQINWVADRIVNCFGGVEK